MSFSQPEGKWEDRLFYPNINKDRAKTHDEWKRAISKPMGPPRQLRMFITKIDGKPTLYVLHKVPLSVYNEPEALVSDPSPEPEVSHRNPKQLCFDWSKDLEWLKSQIKDKSK